MDERSTPPNGPESGQTSNSSTGWSSSDAGSSESHGDQGRSATAKEWLSQLQSMIDNLATNAAPVVKEIGAKAAELAVLAGEKAGPFAQRAADATAVAGSKVAERGRVVAAELRRDAGKGTNGNGNGHASDDTTPSSGTTGTTGTSGTTGMPGGTSSTTGSGYGAGGSMTGDSTISSSGSGSTGSGPVTDSPDTLGE
jgi:hypothetical protein